MALDAEAIQLALIKAGFDVGPDGADGVIGRDTLTAVRAFQKANGLQGTGTIGPKTLTRLGLARSSAAVATTDVRYAWYEEAMRKRGLHEDRDFSALSKYLKSDGKTLGDPRKLPWCGDFVETCIALTLPTEKLPVNPYLARNWLKFGVDCTKAPTLGAVLVFWRGSKTGTSGHVGFYHGEDATHFHVLGGNQSNAVTVARIAKDRLLGARFPASVNKVTGRVKRTAAGVLVTTNEA